MHRTSTIERTERMESQVSYNHVYHAPGSGPGSLLLLHGHCFIDLWITKNSLLTLTSEMKGLMRLKKKKSLIILQCNSARIHSQAQVEVTTLLSLMPILGLDTVSPQWSFLLSIWSSTQAAQYFLPQGSSRHSSGSQGLTSTTMHV